MLNEKLIRSIEEQTAIDRVADPVQAAIRGVLARAPALADFLHGKGLGHPLHAAMVSLPIGAWSVGMMLDVLDLAGRGRRYRRAADTVTAIGLAGAATAALPGLADWSRTRGGAKRVGFIHAALNLTITGIYGGSLAARARGHRKAGIALSMVGYTLAIGSAWLGGELAYRFAVGVRPRPEGRAEEAEEREAPAIPAAEARP